MIEMINVMEAGAVKNPHNVKASKLYDSEHGQAVHITLQPGEELKRHITPVDVFFYVLEGKGVVEIGEEREEVGPDTLVNSPANLPHCWYNKSEGVFRVLVVKLPRPTKSTKLV